MRPDVRVRRLTAMGWSPKPGTPQGQVVRALTYATPVNTSSWFNGSAVVPVLVSAIRPAANAADRTTAFTYDKAGHLVDHGGCRGASPY